MGKYLNPSNILFQRSLNSEIYVDKTELIRYTNRFLNTENNLLCVSRPRRFGKSMALQMLAAYYSRGCDSRELFAGLKICDFEEKPENRKLFEMGLNRYDTLYLDMQGIIGTVLMDVGTRQEILDFQRELPKMSPEEKNLASHPLLTAVQRRIIRDLRKNKEFAVCIPEEETFLGSALQEVYEQTGRQFVILIDEWDCIFRNYEENKYLQDTIWILTD